MAIAQIGLTPPPARPRGATGNVVLIFSRQKRHLSAYYGIKFFYIENDRENDEYDDENGDNFDV